VDAWLAGQRTIVPVVLILDLIEFENACTSPHRPGKARTGVAPQPIAVKLPVLSDLSPWSASVSSGVDGAEAS